MGGRTEIIEAAHVVSDDAGLREAITAMAAEVSKGRFGRIRKKQEVRAFFEGLEPVEPGLVDVTGWRPDGREEKQSQLWVMFGGVARKPA